MKFLLFLLLAFILVFLTSCGALSEGAQVRDPITGALITNSTVYADQRTVDTVISKISRLFKKEDPIEVILTPSN